MVGPEGQISFNFFESVGIYDGTPSTESSSLEVIKFEFILKLKIKRNDWLLADTSPQAANQCAKF